MTPEIESLYRRIGQQMIDVAGESFAKVYARVEMADDVGSVGLFVNRGDGAYHYLVDESGELFDAFFELRRLCSQAGMGAWSQATFAVDSSAKFSIDFGYDDVSDMSAGSARRSAWVERVLGQDVVVHWGS